MFDDEGDQTLSPDFSNDKSGLFLYHKLLLLSLRGILSNRYYLRVVDFLIRWVNYILLFRFMRRLLLRRCT